MTTRPHRDSHKQGALHRAVQLSAAGSRLPPPTRPPRNVRLAGPPVVTPRLRIPAPTIELDDPTVVDERPRPPPSPVLSAAPRHRDTERTDVVTPLPPPPPSPSPSPRPIEPDHEVTRPIAETVHRNRLAVARLGAAVAVAVTATLVLMIGFSTPGPGPMARSVREPVRPQRAAIVEPPPSAPGEPTRQAAEADAEVQPPEESSEADAEVQPEEPVESEHSSEHSAAPRPRSRAGSGASAAEATRRATRSSRAPLLTYDPDALFLKRSNPSRVP